MKPGKTIILAAFLFILTVIAGAAYGMDIDNPMVIREKGKVEVKKTSTDPWRSILSNLMVKKNGAAKTLENSRARIDIWDTSSYVQLEEKSLLWMKDVSKKGSKRVAVLNQERGKIWVKVEKDKVSDTKFQVKTPQALLAIKGTIFYSNVGEADPSAGVPGGAEKKSSGKETSSTGEGPWNQVSLTSKSETAESGVLKGFTRVGVLQGSVSVTSKGKTVEVTGGNFVVVWEGQPPGPVTPDPDLKDPEKVPGSIADEVPGFEEETDSGDFTPITPGEPGSVEHGSPYGY